MATQSLWRVSIRAISVQTDVNGSALVRWHGMSSLAELVFAGFVFVVCFGLLSLLVYWLCKDVREKRSLDASVRQHDRLSLLTSSSKSVRLKQAPSSRSRRYRASASQLTPDNDPDVSDLTVARNRETDLILYCVYDRAIQDILRKRYEQASNSKQYYTNTEVIHRPRLYADMTVHDLVKASRNARERHLGNASQESNPQDEIDALRALYRSEHDTIRRCVFDRAIQRLEEQQNGEVKNLRRYKRNSRIIHNPQSHVNNETDSDDYYAGDNGISDDDDSDSD